MSQLFEPHVHEEPSLTARTDPLNPPGPRKFASDSLAVLEIHLLPMIRQWYLIVLVIGSPVYFTMESAPLGRGKAVPLRQALD